MTSVACDDDRPNVPGGSQGPSHPVGTPTHPDAGADEDSGIADSGPTDGTSPPVFGCESVEVQGASGGDAPMGTASRAPGDLAISRQTIGWQCNPSRIGIGLSDGRCPYGAGHELSFELSLAALQDGVIKLGNNPVTAAADATGISVSYTRPKRLTPHGTWGNCSATEGLLVFLEAPELRANGVLWASYSLPLPACDDSGNEPIMVAGTFKVQLRHNPSEACPGEVP